MTAQLRERMTAAAAAEAAAEAEAAAAELLNATVAGWAPERAALELAKEEAASMMRESAAEAAELRASITELAVR